MYAAKLLLFNVPKRPAYLYLLIQMLLRERILHRADDIALRIKHEFPIASEEWTRWTNRTAAYNTTSLTQAISTYFAEHSIGDVGDAGSNYVPRAGYVGTLAPGENFVQDQPMEELPNKILHPWPAFQQHAFHVRWAPSHPMTPPPLLWFALNNMYTDVRQLCYMQLLSCLGAANRRYACTHRRKIWLSSCVFALSIYRMSSTNAVNCCGVYTELHPIRAEPQAQPGGGRHFYGTGLRGRGDNRGREVHGATGCDPHW
jgi:hypothetical protein